LGIDYTINWQTGSGRPVPVGAKVDGPGGRAVRPTRSETAMPRRAAPPAPMPYIPARRSRRGLHLFGGLYTLMLIAGFAVGFRAGSSKPTPTAKPILVASAKTNTTIARADVTTAPPQAEPKAKPPEPKATEPKVPEKEPTLLVAEARLVVTVLVPTGSALSLEVTERAEAVMPPAVWSMVLPAPSRRLRCGAEWKRLLT